jgi:hypothetical protein
MLNRAAAEVGLEDVDYGNHSQGETHSNRLAMSAIHQI